MLELLKLVRERRESGVAGIYAQDSGEVPRGKRGVLETLYADFLKTYNAMFT
jgi:hypothetical protein